MLKSHRHPTKASSRRSALTLLELILVSVVVVVGLAVAVVELRSAREVARLNYQREYRTGFVEGVLIAIREDDAGGMRCFAPSGPHTEGFDDGRSLIGARLSYRRDLSIRDRVEYVSGFVGRCSDIDDELCAQIIEALERVHPLPTIEVQQGKTEFTIDPTRVIATQQ